MRSSFLETILTNQLLLILVDLKGIDWNLLICELKEYQRVRSDLSTALEG